MGSHALRDEPRELTDEDTDWEPLRFSVLSRSFDCWAPSKTPRPQARGKLEAMRGKRLLVSPKSPVPELQSPRTPRRPLSSACPPDSLLPAARTHSSTQDCVYPAQGSECARKPTSSPGRWHSTSVYTPSALPGNRATSARIRPPPDFRFRRAEAKAGLWSLAGSSGLPVHFSQFSQCCWFVRGSARIVAAPAKSLQSCPTLCDPRDGSPPGSPVPGILQAKILEWVAISFSNAWKWKVKVKSLSRVRLFTTPWTAAYQAPPPMRFSRQEYWSGLPLPSPARVVRSG